jgi:hypothetical protein
MSPNQIRKYPRTKHIEGSRLQPGDEDLAAVKFCELAGPPLVVEEKMDGANCGISFSRQGELLLQSRGHYLTGGLREKHFTLFKQWASTHAQRFREVLSDRYVLYGEWLFAKHTIFYDALPHYFLEFDVLDVQADAFLSTPRRQELLRGLPIVSVHVLHAGAARKLTDLTSLIGPSRFIRPGHLGRLRELAVKDGVDPDRVLRETDRTELMEGLYLKTETDEIVTGRYKFVRANFLTAVLTAEGHWLNRPIIPNTLLAGADLFQA